MSLQERQTAQQLVEECRNVLKVLMPRCCQGKDLEASKHSVKEGILDKGVITVEQEQARKAKEARKKMSANAPRSNYTP